MSAEANSLSSASEPDLGQTISQVVSDASGLIRAEAILAKAETADNARQMGAAAGRIAAGVGLLTMAIIFLLVALVVALAEAIGLLWSLLLVAAILLVIGLVLAIGGRTKMQSLSLLPNKSLDRLSQDLERLSNRNTTASQAHDGGMNG